MRVNFVRLLPRCRGGYSGIRVRDVDLRQTVLQILSHCSNDCVAILLNSSESSPSGLRFKTEHDQSYYVVVHDGPSITGTRRSVHKYHSIGRCSKTTGMLISQRNLRQKSSCALQNIQNKDFQCSSTLTREGVTSQSAKGHISTPRSCRVRNTPLSLLP
ncbi:hypothetical protein BDR03DRAFT_181022 [Suillus americanus]|nr:hypothetical protein BDR03DRAFT_181022 [Suillus americanus]